MPITVAHQPGFGLPSQAAFTVGAGMRQQQIQDALRDQAMALERQQYAGALQANRDIRLNQFTLERDRALSQLGMGEDRYRTMLNAWTELQRAGITDHQSNVAEMFRARDDYRRYGLDEQSANNAASRDAALRAFQLDLTKNLAGFEFGLSERGKLSSFDLAQQAADAQLYRQAELNQQEAGFALGRIGYSSEQQRQLAMLQYQIDKALDDPTLRADERKAVIAEANARVQAIRDRPWAKEGGGVMTIKEREDAGILRRNPDGSVEVLTSDGELKVYRTDGGQLREQLATQKLQNDQLKERLRLTQQQQQQQVSPSDIARLYQVGAATLQSQLGRMPTEQEVQDFVRRSIQMQREFGGGTAGQGGGLNVLQAIGGAVSGYMQGGLPGAVLGGFAGAASGGSRSATGPAFIGPQGRSYSAEDVQTTARRYGMSADEVIRRAGLRPAGQPSAGVAGSTMGAPVGG